LREIDHSRRQFFANISHELRTPTTAILGESEITLRRSGHPEAFYRETLERVAAIARQLGARIAELMAVARQSEDNKAIEVDAELIDLPALLQQALDQQSAAATQQGHQLALALPLPTDVKLRGSAAKLGQALTILIDNAIRYTPAEGQIRVGAQRAHEDTQRLHIWVEDNGIGMRPQDLLRATERYWRSDEARKLRPDGMGLGLPIAEGIAQSHGGQLLISSRPEGGCRVVLSLPLAQDDA